MRQHSAFSAFRGLTGREPHALDNLRLQGFLNNLAPELRDDPGMFQFILVLIGHLSLLDDRLAEAKKVAAKEAENETHKVFAAAAQKIAAARPDVTAARAQAFRLLATTGFACFVLAYLSLIGLLKTGYVSYPHLSETEQSQLDLGREIDARGNREVARWAASAIRNNVSLSEVSAFVYDLEQGRNARAELAGVPQCRIKGARIVMDGRNWACLFPLQR